MKFAYKKYPFRDGGFAYSAVLNVNLALPARNSPRSKRFEALIDSGASRCIFHTSIGKALGLDIEKGDPENTLGVNGISRVYVHNVSLYAPSGIIAIRAGFSHELPLAGLLGMNGFFEQFRVLFDPTFEGFELDRVFLA